MENAQKVIEDFFAKKIQDSVTSGYEEILKPIRNKKKNHKHNERLEKYTKEEDALESNQWIRTKLDSLAVLFSDHEKLSELVQKGIDLYQDNPDPNELKIKLSTQFKILKKEVGKSQLPEQDKRTFGKIEIEKLQPDKNSKNNRLLERLADIDPEIMKEMIKVKELARKKFDQNSWLCNAAQKSAAVSVGMTHIAKLTHSSARGASNFNAFTFGIQQPKTFLTTANLVEKQLPTDFTYSTAEYSPIAEFLQLDCSGEMLGKLICNNPLILESYANKNDGQLQEWQTQFGQAFNEKNKSSHTLLKQVYFPASSEKGYHLLTPLVSSSLAQIIYDRIWKTRQNNISVRNSRKANVYSSEIDRLFYQTAILKVTQSKKAHTNVSSLNVKRDGQLFLLPAIPPQWRSQTKPPIHLKNMFNKQLAAQAKEPLTELKNLLLAIKVNQLSINLQRRQLISAHIIDVADIVFDYAAQIQRLTQQAGWSRESNLPVHQQFWLDPLRPDEEFQSTRATLDWPLDLVVDFSKWIDININHKQLTKSAAREKQWQKMFAPLLREFNALAETDLEIDIVEKQA